MHTKKIEKSKNVVCLIWEWLIHFSWLSFSYSGEVCSHFYLYSNIMSVHVQRSQLELSLAAITGHHYCPLLYWSGTTFYLCTLVDNLRPHQVKIKKSRISCDHHTDKWLSLSLSLSVSGRHARPTNLCADSKQSEQTSCQRDCGECRVFYFLTNNSVHCERVFFFI